MKQMPLNITLRHEASFDSFVAEAESLAMVLYQLQMAIIRQQAGAWYFYGPEGVGKTHLLQAACRFAQQWERRCVYLNLEDDEVRNFPDLLKGLEEMEVLCLDALDAVLPDSNWQDRLGQVLLHAQTLGHMVLLSGQQPMADWPLQSEVLADALATVVPVSVMPLVERESIMLAVQRHGQVRGLQLPKNVISYLIRVFGEDLEAVLLALQRIEQVSLIEKRRITLPFVKRVLSHQEPVV